MNRLKTEEVKAATGKSAQLFQVIEKAVGTVPNAYVTMGTNSPLALEAILALDAATRRSSLSAAEMEAIKLTVSQAAGCDYCLAAHTMFGRKAGLSPEALKAARHGTPSGNAKLDALTTFVRQVVTTSGTVPLSLVSAARDAGYTDAQIIDSMLVIALITLSNVLNRVNDTPIDFPSVS
jgi:uncharacterized peroxidase-related enzyme